MESAAIFLSLLSLLVLVSIVSSSIVPRIGIPVLLIYLVFGMLAGEQGPGRILYDDVSSAYLVGSAALAVILFDGGLRTDPASFRVGLRPALSLATVGVVISAAITAVAVRTVLDTGWLEALLMGAIVGSTDAAAVFSLLRGQGLSLQQRVGSTLEIESGANDPMAVFLTVLLIQAVMLGVEPGWEALGSFFWQMGMGAAAGVLAGWVLAWSITHLHLNAALYPLLVLFGAWMLFGIVALFDGSGFLAVYLAGLVLARRVSRGLYNIEKFLDGIAWLAQIVMFLMLGLLVTPGDLLPMAANALVVGLVLIFLARPVAVFVCLLPFRFSWRENLFVSWVGLRGAVPIILALFPWIAGLPNHQTYFNIAFFVVLLSLLLQGWTVAPLARLLGLEVPSRKTRMQRIELGMPGQETFELIGYTITTNSRMLDHSLSATAWPASCRPVLVIRSDRVLEPQAVGVPLVGDLVYLLARPADLGRLDEVFADHGAQARAAERAFFGDFTIRADAPLEALAELYGMTLTEEHRALTISQLLESGFTNPVVGDRIQVGDLEFTVREIRDGKIHSVGLKLNRPS